ncbi:hypothetical protein [Nocardioides sp. zg-DK7169]|uniref:hypothetical protein n=1 Tax=Nocardioides sp. zg-DK7169 TaxID=2736600 RepID=UPI001551A988|nr:hypothetical protein [Nocardioides sp. zg-DK7169]NPC97873.1 hypothetical protein [Nocardioides sp. zg-DK7169]
MKIRLLRPLASLLASGGLLVSSLAVAPAARAADPVGFLDAVSVTPDGYVAVSGWAQDPDTPDAAVEIHVYSTTSYGSRRLLGTTTAGLHREDVGPHGFAASFQPPGDLSPSETVCAYAIDPTGSNPLLPPCHEVRIPHPDAMAFLEELKVQRTTLRVAGRAYDANSQGRPIKVRISIDGARVATVLANRPAPKSFWSQAPHWFRTRVKHPVGTFELCLRPVNVGAGTSTGDCLMMPAARMTGPAKKSTRAKRVKLSWRGIQTEQLGPGLPYSVRHRSRPAARTGKGGWTSWTVPGARRALTTMSVRSQPLRKGRTYCFSVRPNLRAAGGDGSVSLAWSPPRCVTRR